MYVDCCDCWYVILMISIERIFQIADEAAFNECCLEVYEYQSQHCEVYRNFVQNLHHPQPKHYSEIPFLPIGFFKTHEVISDEKDVETVFKSSGTGGERSQHFVASTELYRSSFLKAYSHMIGDPKEQVILALLPNYLEQGSSSLVYMVDHLIQLSGAPSSFVLNDHQELLDQYRTAISMKKQPVIFGVSYALLDLGVLSPDLSEAIIIETGGMKGRRKEITKAELHDELSKTLNCKKIYSEYGMTELMSQAYSKEDMIFHCPSWMKVLIRETNDPFKYESEGKTGGINVIDLANLYSCSFIATQDLGRITSGGFEVMGRFDNADLRGCNLLVQ